MNRRSFLFKAGSTALVATGGLGSSRKSWAQTSLESTLDTQTNAHSSIIAGSFYGTSQPYDFRRLSLAHSYAANALIQADFDTSFKAQIANVSASDLNPASNDYSSVVQRIQTYAPDFQSNDLQFLMNYLSYDPTAVDSTLTDLQQNGLIPTVQNSATVYQQMYQALLAQGDASPKFLRTPFHRGSAVMASQKQDQRPNVTPAIYTPQSQRPTLTKATWQHPFLTLGSDGGGGYSCAADSMAGLAFGTAVAVVTVMCVFSVVVMICGPVLLTWAGSAGAAWALGHAVACGIS